MNSIRVLPPEQTYMKIVVTAVMQTLAYESNCTEDDSADANMNSLQSSDRKAWPYLAVNTANKYNNADKTIMEIIHIRTHMRIMLLPLNSNNNDKLPNTCGSTTAWEKREFKKSELDATIPETLPKETLRARTTRKHA